MLFRIRGGARACVAVFEFGMMKPYNLRDLTRLFSPTLSLFSYVHGSSKQDTWTILFGCPGWRSLSSLGQSTPRQDGPGRVMRQKVRRYGPRPRKHLRQMFPHLIIVARPWSFCEFGAEALVPNPPMNRLEKA